MGQINIIFVCTNHNKILSENKMLYPYIYWSRKEGKSLHKDNINDKNVVIDENYFLWAKIGLRTHKDYNNYPFCHVSQS